MFVVDNSTDALGSWGFTQGLRWAGKRRNGASGFYRGTRRRLALFGPCRFGVQHPALGAIPSSSGTDYCVRLLLLEAIHLLVYALPWRVALAKNTNVM